LKKEKDRRGLCLDVVDTYAFDAITNMALGYHHFLYQGISKVHRWQSLSQQTLYLKITVWKKLKPLQSRKRNRSKRNRIHCIAACLSKQKKGFKMADFGLNIMPGCLVGRGKLRTW